MEKWGKFDEFDEFDTSLRLEMRKARASHIMPGDLGLLACCCGFIPHPDETDCDRLDPLRTRPEELPYGLSLLSQRENKKLLCVDLSTAITIESEQGLCTRSTPPVDNQARCSAWQWPIDERGDDDVYDAVSQLWGYAPPHVAPEEIAGDKEDADDFNSAHEKGALLEETTVDEQYEWEKMKPKTRRGNKKGKIIRFKTADRNDRQLPAKKARQRARQQKQWSRKMLAATA